MKKALIVLFILGFANSAFAAKFKPIKKMKHASGQALVELMAKVAELEPIFGDATEAKVYSFTRDPGEKDYNTVRQLVIAKAGVFEEESTNSGYRKTPSFLLEHLLLTVDGFEDEDEVYEYDLYKNKLLDALTAIQDDGGLRSYWTSHADEDGSFQVLVYIDIKNKQIMYARVGFHGT